MASWSEIERVRKDPKAFKPLAKQLLADPYSAEARSENATDFLEKISCEAWTFFEIADGLSVEILIGKCFLARLELSRDDDIERIEALKASGRTFITGKQITWFKRICRELGEIEAYV
jgi:hypothetical protein